MLADVRRSAVSGIETLVIDDDTRPVIVGERTNVLGSRKFKELIATGKIEEASEVGRAQVRRGAHIIDVCLQDPDRPETEDMTQFLEMVVKKVKVPIMLDSTDHKVLEESLKRTQGKSLINSINLEDGEERFQKVVPLARTFGAALVVGCIDEDKAQAQAITRERKLAIAAALARHPDRRSTASRPRTSSSTRSSSRSGPATRTTSARASRRSKASA